jgi:hypothetical protein
MAIAEVHVRLGKLLAVIDEILDSSSADIRVLERLVDSARWAKVYIDFELAFQKYQEVADAAWATRRFLTEVTARQTLAEFRSTLSDVAATTAGVVPLRNLRARVEGVLNVAQDWWKWKAEEK